MKQTKFEQDLRQFFPDIWELHSYGKMEKFLWDAVRAIKEMRDRDASGTVMIRFSAGKIDKIVRSEDILFGVSRRPNLNYPAEVDEDDFK